jgi:hypothetical protein
VAAVYLSPDLPRWTPESEDDLRSAINGGLLDESHRLDLKREIEPGRAANRELARDLSSFAIDGGVLLLGLEEVDGRLALAPQPLTGLAERVEQVARSIPDPPLAVVSRSILCADDPMSGYLIVTVPPSGQAPHMVDHRYIGRGDKTKMNLSDAEVRRLHERRRATETDVLGLIDVEIARDPIPLDVRQNAHLFIVAEPLPGRNEMLLDVVSGDNWQQRLLALRDDGVKAVRSLAVGKYGFSPDLNSASIHQRRAHGAALTSYGLRSAGEEEKELRERRAIELEVSEDGQLRLFCGRLSDHYSSGDTEMHALFDAAAIVLLRQFIGVIAAAADRSGYFGAWGLGIGATGLKGLQSYENSKGFWDGPAYQEDVYKRVALANFADLTQTPGRLTNVLLGRLLRALATEKRFNDSLL